jgi:hypothetical protein
MEGRFWEIQDCALVTYSQYEAQIGKKKSRSGERMKTYLLRTQRLQRIRMIRGNKKSAATPAPKATVVNTFVLIYIFRICNTYS